MHSVQNSIDTAHKVAHARRTSQVWHMVHFFYPAGANPTGQAVK